VAWVVAYGKANRTLDAIEAVGIDEVAVWKGHKYLTVVYDIGKDSVRLLWVGKDRTEKTLHGFFDVLGDSRSKAIKYVASDMWKPYLKVIAERAGQALNILDRFHIVKHLNEAIDEVRRKEAKKMADDGYDPVLKRSRWCFLKRPENLTPGQETKLAEVLQYNLRTVRAYVLKEAFEAFWHYRSSRWAGWFLDRWCTRVMRSRLDPMKKFVGMVRSHRELILNWFRASGEVSNGISEAMNCNVKLAIRKARGFRSLKVLEIALFHQLGRLPEPETTHRFC
jgi:transposase